MVAATATFVAGGVTVANGAAEVIESVTEYNYMRDGVFGGDAAFYSGQRDAMATAASIGTMVVGAASASGAVCFAAGTMIQTEDRLKPIEEIEAGDKVWAWDEATGERAVREVLETYVNETDELVHIFAADQEITCTPGHPFYSPVKGWTEAVHLRAGDILVLVNGEYVVVEKIQHELLEAPINVYNFNVEGFHTYYVSSIGVLVHNSCGETAATRYGREIHRQWDYGPTVETEQRIGVGARVDGIDRINRIIYELKPNNPRAIRQGLRQLERYLEFFDDSWAGILVLYDK